ncbi:ROK family protein [Actinocorallia lasiicapitis]
MRALGIDVGGTGIKGAPVDTETGTLVVERLKLPTPRPAKPEAVAEVVMEIARHFGWRGVTGVTFPGVVHGGVVYTAANVDHAWIGTDADALFSRDLGDEVHVLNDADAAGLAEVKYGAGREVPGLVIMTTLGTGIGSALFWNGQLIPNTELGHLEIRGKEAEKRASELVRESHELSWEAWAERLSEYYRTLEALFSPSLFIIGGGVSKKHEKFLPLIDGVRAPIVPAALHNDAGIVGAALFARRAHQV